MDAPRNDISLSLSLPGAGLVRFTDLPQRRSLVEIDFDGLSPGNEHTVGVHRSGDVGGKSKSLLLATLTHKFSIRC
jgi:hypothetical protein